MEPWQESKKRKAVATSKFYFFDIGVANFLSDVKVLNANSDEFGRAFEHFIAMELRSYLSYQRTKLSLSYWRTHNKTEVDFVIGNVVAIEVKATHRVQDKHLKGIRALKEENILEKYYVVAFDELERTTDDGIEIIHWKKFITKLWQKNYF